MLCSRVVNHMREFVKSSLSLGIGLSLLTLKQTENLFRASNGDGRGASARSLDAVNKAAVEQLGGTLRNTFSALDNVQRGLVEIGFAFMRSPIEMPWSFGRNQSRDTRETTDSRNAHVFRDDVGFDTRRATILRSRKPRDEERFHDATTGILAERRS